MMKKVFLLLLICLVAFNVSAQRAAVMEFKAGAGVSQADVDGISAIFITYFNPAGYTMVERTQIDRVIDEEMFQRGRLTEQQMVRIGQILHVSKIVVGDINVVMGQYNVDVRVVNVETGTVAAKEGATFSGSYRASMQTLATKLAGKIAIKQGPTIPVTPAPNPQPQATRTTPYVIYGYLKVFPNDLGSFESVPTTVITQINKASQYGYNTWRIPTKEELSLMVANNVITSTSDYMASDGRSSGKVRLVTDKETAQAIAAAKAEAEARAKAEAKAKAEAEAREKAELQRKIENARAQGYVYLGLPSGTLWKDKNEEGGFYTYDQAMAKFGSKLPTKEQLEELKSSCQWNWTGNGYKVVGPSGESIVLPAAGYRYCDGIVAYVGSGGYYWSSTPNGSINAWRLYFNSGGVYMNYKDRCVEQSVRLVQ